MEMDNSGGSIIHLHFKRKSISNNSEDKIKVRQEAPAAADCVDEEDTNGCCNSCYARSCLLNGLNYENHNHRGHKTAGASNINNSNLLDEYDYDDNSNNIHEVSNSKKTTKITLSPVAPVPPKGASFTSLSVEDAMSMVRRHRLPCVLTLSLLFFMGVEYTLRMVPPSSPPLDIGFLLTRSLHALLATRPSLNSLLAALNTVFVGMQTAYILWTLLVEGRPRSTIAALFMFTCRGILGYSTQLPLPQGFLGSGADFPVGNVSFFLFFSGHVAGSLIASMDMRRMRRHKMAWSFDALNILQALRLLATRGHYTIDLAVGIGAGFLFDILAGKYEESKKHHGGEFQRINRVCCSCSR